MYLILASGVNTYLYVFDTVLRECTAFLHYGKSSISRLLEVLIFLVYSVHRMTIRLDQTNSRSAS